MLLLMDFCATNALLALSNCLHTYRTDWWLEGELSGDGRWRLLSITKATGSEALPKFCSGLKWRGYTPVSYVIILVYVCY